MSPSSHKPAGCYTTKTIRITDISEHCSHAGDNRRDFERCVAGRLRTVEYICPRKGQMMTKFLVVLKVSVTIDTRPY